MRTKKIIFKGFLSAALFGLVLTGCKKNETEDTDTSASSDNATAEAYFNDMGNISNEGAISGSVSSYKNSPAANDGLLSACATVGIQAVNHADVDSVTIDFGTSNCLCNDGRFRRGKIFITYTGGYLDSGTVVTTVPINYYVNDNQLLGTRTVTNMGRNSSNNLYYNISVSGQVVLASNGGTITWNSTRQREWTAGESTPLVWSDDVYSITGSANGTSAQGLAYTVAITSPLIKNMSLACRKHFVQGVFDLTPQGKATRTVDYGTGACDNKATVTINGKTYNITLK